jgi:hypothetical protein
LDLFQSNAVLDTDNLLLQGHGLFETLQNDIREACNHGKAIVGGVENPGIQDFIGSRSKLAIGVVSGED